jgi:hypothetical protein
MHIPLRSFLAAATAAAACVVCGRVQAAADMTVAINQNSALGLPCQGGGSLSGSRFVFPALVSLSGSCADAFGSSLSSAYATPGGLGVMGKAVSASGVTLGEVGGGTANFDAPIILTSSNPNAVDTIVRMRIHFGGTLGSVSDTAATQVGVSLRLNGVLNGLLINESLNNGPTGLTCAETGMSGTGFCDGLTRTGTLDTTLTTVPVRVPLNVPFAIGFTMTVSAGASLVGSSTADFSNTLRFVSDEDVFLVDPDISVNAPDLGLANNRYIPLAVPEPATLSTMLVGLLALALRRRRRATC